MKANEAPEKIFLFENPINGTPDDRWLSKRSDDEDIEYTRTDVFIDKAADKFKQFMYDQHFFEGMVYQDAIIENLVGYFKNYMKEE